MTSIKGFCKCSVILLLANFLCRGLFDYSFVKYMEVQEEK